VTTSNDLSRLFEAERAVRPPPQALEHGLSRLLSDVAQQVAPVSVGTGSLKLGWSFVSKWLVGGFVVGLAGAGAASQIGAPQKLAAAPTQASVARGTRVEASALAPTAPPALAAPPALTAPPASPVAAPPEPQLHEPAQARSERPAPSTAPASSDGATTFDAELRLISAAKRELDQGRPQLAAAWLSEHAARFPAGIFALDREAMRILVRCSQAKDPSLAQAFAEQHADSPMVGRLLRACTPAEPSASASTVDFPK